MKRFINLKNLNHFFQSPKNIVGFLFVSTIFWFASGSFHKIKTEDAKIKEEKLFTVEITESKALKQFQEVISRGSINAKKSIQLKAETSGEIIEILKPKGSVVKKGEVILKLKEDDRPKRLSEAKARLEQRRMEFKAAQKLVLQSFRSETSLAEAKSQLESAEAALARIEQDIEHASVTAPFDGIFDQTTLEVGSVLSMNENIGSFINLEKVKVVLNIPEKDASLIKVGGQANLLSPYNTDKKLQGVVTYISRSADSRTRTYKVEIEAENSNMLFYDGMTVEAKIPVKEVLAHLVHFSLLTLNEKGILGVKTVDEKSKVLFHKVTPLKMENGKIWVTDLPEHVKIISTGQDFVKFDQQVLTQKALEEK